MLLCAATINCLKVLCLSVDGWLPSSLPIHCNVPPLGLQCLQDCIVLSHPHHPLQHHALPLHVGHLGAVWLAQAVVVVECEGVRNPGLLGKEFLKKLMQKDYSKTVRIQLGLHDLHIGILCKEVQSQHQVLQSVHGNKARTLLVYLTKLLLGFIPHRRRAHQLHIFGKQHSQVGL